MSRGRLPLLVVDGYNVIWGTQPYHDLIDEDDDGAHSLPDVARLSRDPYGHDPFERAREALVADVAAYARGTFEPVIVYDGAKNRSASRPDLSVAGVRVIFSREGESADAVIERRVVVARHQMREVTLVTSDNAIRFTVGGIPVTTISSALLAADLDIVRSDTAQAREERTHARMTLEDRLSPEERERLRRLLGR